MKIAIETREPIIWLYQSDQQSVVPAHKILKQSNALTDDRDALPAANASGR